MALWLRNVGRFTVLIAIYTLLAGCFVKPYRFDLHQGNIIAAEKVAQIQPGMSREQVRYLLGTPVLNDVFETDRWDYIYLEVSGKGAELRKHLAVFFHEGRVARVTRDVMPEYA